MDAAQATKYIRVARALRRSATDLAGIAEDTSSYGNAIAIISIHSAIAYADALTISYGGFKSVEGEHARAADALREALGARAGPTELRTLQSILKRKDAASYQGVYYSLADARRLVESLEDFAEWAERVFSEHP